MRVKVSELAAELRKTNKDIMDKAAELEIDAKSATKLLSEAEAEAIRHGFDASAASAVEEKKARMMPRRIAKAEVEEAERAKAEAEAAEEEKRQREEAAAKAAENIVPVLKVAKQAASKPKPEKTEAVQTGKPDAEPDKPAPSLPARSDQVGAEAPVVVPEKQEAPVAAAPEKKKAPEKPAPAPVKQETHRAPSQAQTPASAEKGGKPTAENKAGESAAVAAKGQDKEPDKKGGKPKDTKSGASTQDAAAKKKGKNTKKSGRDSSFRGAAKGPVPSDGSLEKEKRKKHHGARLGGEMLSLLDVPAGTFVINVPITVAGFAEQIEGSTSEIIMALMKMGVMANINQNLDEETVQLLAVELDIPIIIGRDEGEIVEEGIESFEDDAEDLVPRPPIITVMGHVDHGKTSLLDAIRNTNVTDKEAGGITQHIGASEVIAPSGERIVFLDTPGHEAFTAMRARGAHVTDIAVLVVAADDGVMPQTIESISHAKAAGIPIIVAINKIDKAGANTDRVKQELADNGVLVEEWGGEVISVPVSAKTGEGIDNLLEMILLQAEVLELRANPNRLALGTVIEARLDKSKGPLATLLVLNGTLKDKMSIVAGTTSAKIRAMTDFVGKPIRSAAPATAVEITGFLEVPHAGDEFHALLDDRLAKSIAEKRRIRQREQVMAKTVGTSLENLFDRIREGAIKELKVIIKADVMGSVGAIAASLEKIDVEGVRVNIIHRGVGTVTESDIMLASTSGAIIIGFNVRPSTNVFSLAELEGVEIRLYRVIYDVISEVEAALKGMLDPEFREVVLGKATVRETFRLPNGNQVAGSYVTEGKILRNAEIRLVRDGVVIHEGRIGSLRRFKDDVREVDRGYECGIGIDGYGDIKLGDEIEAFRMEEIERS